MSSNAFNWQSFFVRVFFALILVFASYNPSGYSYFDWVLQANSDYLPYLVLSGLILIVGWAIFVQATMRSLGAFGLGLAVAFSAAILWVVVDSGIIPVNNVEVITYIVLVFISLILGIGLSWSHVRLRLSGQRDVDDVEE